MKIDEMIMKFEDVACYSSKLGIGINVNFNADKAQDVLDMLKELKYYKSQDLVRRDDIKDKAICAYGLPCQFDHKCYKCEYALLTMNNIYDIPKVEYGGIE